MKAGTFRAKRTGLIARSGRENLVFGRLFDLVCTLTLTNTFPRDDPPTTSTPPSCLPTCPFRFKAADSAVDLVVQKSPSAELLWSRMAAQTADSRVHRRVLGIPFEPHPPLKIADSVVHNWLLLEWNRLDTGARATHARPGFLVCHTDTHIPAHARSDVCVFCFCFLQPAYVPPVCVYRSSHGGWMWDCPLLFSIRAAAAPPVQRSLRRASAEGAVGRGV